MLDFNLEYYRAFYYTVKLGSFTKAAKALFVSQPAVSHSIMKLEEYMNCQLIDRTSRHLKTTDEGRALYEYVSKAFELLSLGEQKIIQAEKYRSGTITISSSETPLQMVVLPALNSFRAKYPEIFINIIGGGSSSFSAAHLNNSEADIALGILPAFSVENADIYYGPKIESIAICGPDYKLNFDGPLSARELTEYELICSDKDSSARNLLDNWFLEQGIIFEPAYSVMTTNMILSLVEQNLGIGIIPAVFAKKLLKQHKVREVRLKEYLPQRSVIVASSRNEQKKALCKLFIDHLLEIGLVQPADNDLP